MEVVKTIRREYYTVVSSTYGGENNTTASWMSGHFKTEKEAKEAWDKKYHSRNKGDQYDAYWNSIPFMVEHVVEIIERNF
jgi:hypothetical protein